MGEPEEQLSITELLQELGSGELTLERGAQLFEAIDAEMKRIIETNYARVRQLLQDNRDALETLSRELLDVEDMDGETLERRLEELGAARVAFTPHSLRAG